MSWVLGSLWILSLLGNHNLVSTRKQEYIGTQKHNSEAVEGMKRVLERSRVRLCFTLSLNYDMIIPKLISFVFVRLYDLGHLFALFSFVCFVFSCFVVSTYSRKIRLHTQHTNFSICIGSHRQTANTNSHG